MMERHDAEQVRPDLLAPIARARGEAKEPPRDELVLLISHDLRNALGVLSGYVQLAMRDMTALKGSEKDRIQGRFTHIASAISQINRLVTEMVDLVQARADHSLSLHRAAIDLLDLVRRRATVYQDITSQCDIRVEAAVEDSGLVGYWDADGLERVIDNLLANAIKYSPDGGELTIHISSEQVGGQPWAMFVVQDHGIGIPPGDLPHIFEGFQRAGNVREQIPGMGLGLVSAKRIVEQHGGTITATSVAGVGTTMTVRLPIGAPDDRSKS